MKLDGVEIWLYGAAISLFLALSAFLVAALMGFKWAPLLLIGVPLIGFPISWIASEIWFCREYRDLR